MDKSLEIGAAIFTAVIGLAIVAVIFSRQSATSQVIGAAGSAFSGLLGVAVSPITGGSNPVPHGFTPSNSPASPTSATFNGPMVLNALAQVPILNF